MGRYQNDMVGRLVVLMALLSVCVWVDSSALYAAPDEPLVPIAQAPIDEPSMLTYRDEKLSLDFQDIAVRAALQLMAEVADLNLVVSDAVSGRLTLRLHEVPWHQALSLILQTQGLDKRQMGNVLIIAPALEIAERERQLLESQRQMAGLLPLYTEHIQLYYAEAQAVYELLQAKNHQRQDHTEKPLLSARGSIIVDERTNALFITDTEQRLARIYEVIAQIDIPIRQVLVEAHIIMTHANYNEQLGIRWGGAALSHLQGKPLVASGSMEGVVNAENRLDPTVPLNLWPDGNSLPFDLSDSSVVDLGVRPASGSFAVGYLGSRVALNLELSALESQGRGEIISQPKVITGNKQTAMIKSGTEVPYQQSSANGETTVAFKEAVLKLAVTPNIIPDDRIIMDLVINQDSVGELVPSGNGGFIPTINTTELITQVLVADGETVVLGGVFRGVDVSSESAVPWLSALPYLGRLFKMTSVSHEKMEILIFITPKVLADTLY